MTRSKTILVTGGAGYIGSHMVNLLLRSGYHVLVLDNLSTGSRDAVSGAQLLEGDLADCALLDQILQDNHIDAVMHFAASVQVRESVTNPAKYYRNNFVNAMNMLDAMVKHEVKHFIFSSTASVYGEPHYLPMDEKHPKNPVNPYGQSKWMVEQILSDYKNAYDINYVALRYFNAAGANPEQNLGPRYPEFTHLILLVLEVALGKREKISIFGQDYETPDGTCMRDYVHVMDLCQAHLLALEALFQGKTLKPAYNLGAGQAYSVKQVIEAARRITGHAIPSVEVDRRLGDPAELLADSTLAQKELSWTLQRSTLENMVEDTWQFFHFNK